MKFLGLIFSSIILILSTTVYADDNQEKIDLSKRSLIEYKSGYLSIIDFYSFKPIEINSSPRLNFKIRQEKVSLNTQDCGRLGPREILISSGDISNTLIKINAVDFDELVSAKDMLKTYEDVWDNLDKDKRKLIFYDFAKVKDNNSSKEYFSARMLLNGDRENLYFSIYFYDKDGRSTTVFETTDLKVMSQFNLLVNDVQKFLKSHRFEECL